MTNSQDPAEAAPAAALLAAVEDYAAVCRSLVERAARHESAASLPTLAALSAPWQSFARSMGMAAPAAGSGSPEAVRGGGMPALGWSREYQETAQRMVDLSVRFQTGYTQFLGRGARIAEDAWAALNASSAPPSPASSGSPESLYAAWIDHAEAAYAQAARSESFARAFGEMCNVLSEFKVERACLLERVARHLDLPSREEVDSLHRQVRALAAELRESKIDSAPGRVRE